jgi:hypothetical protein
MESPIRVDTVAVLRSKLAKRRVWRRLFLERLTEPLHLNLMSCLVLAFGSYRDRVDWDLVVRPHHAFGVLKAADTARTCGLSEVVLAEFGVASGAGLMNLAAIASAVTAETGVSFHIHGFDTGSGMPSARDYRDHPDLYQEGDFGMDVEGLASVLPPNVQLHLGPLGETVPRFLAGLGPHAPLGFVSLDVDYWSSTTAAMRVLDGPPEAYLPLLPVYVDDVTLDQHNSACGARLAIAEFNEGHPLRPVELHPFLEHSRVFRRASWLRQMYYAHILDHRVRASVHTTPTKRYIENPYLRHERQKERFDLLQPPAEG